MHDFAIEAPAHMPQSAHSACVRCREHLLKGCGRTDGFWQSRGRIAREVFINRAQRVCPETKRTASSWGQTQSGRIDHQSNAATVNFGSQMHEEPSAPMARGSKVQRVAWSSARQMRTTHQQTRLGWLARAALILRPAPTSPTRETMAIFAICSLYYI